MELEDPTLNEFNHSQITTYCNQHKVSSIGKFIGKGSMNRFMVTYKLRWDER